MTADASAVTVIHCWSAPRSRSTALLYSFEAREDTVALDEPLYATWLLQTGRPRPYLAAVQAAAASDSNNTETQAWRNELVPLRQRIRNAAQKLHERSNGSGGGVIFLKQMAKFFHLYSPATDEEAEFEYLSSGKNESVHKIPLRHVHILLIRDPLDVLSSWNVLDPVHGGHDDDAMEELGLRQLYQIFTTQPVAVVVDAEELRLDPQATLRHVCDQVQIPFVEEM